MNIKSGVETWRIGDLCLAGSRVDEPVWNQCPSWSPYYLNGPIAVGHFKDERQLQ